MSKREQAKTEFEEGSGNVFADLELEDANERFARHNSGFMSIRSWKRESSNSAKSLLCSGSSNRRCPI